MDVKNHDILDGVLAHLDAVHIDTLANHERVTENLRINMAGSVTDTTTGLVRPASQAADKPTNEAG